MRPSHRVQIRRGGLLMFSIPQGLAGIVFGRHSCGVLLSAVSDLMLAGRNRI
jgi:hypothetical protein